ncbi:MAG TPA: GAF domain-containing protein, partial [Armatimonadota bacterium]|nr:GAF domain-containing protein [Armatimonadota bacterium]
MSVPDSLLNRIAGTAAVATKSEVAIITVTDRQDNIIRVVGGHNINVRGITGSIIHVDAESFCGVVTSTGQYAVTRNLAQLPTPVRTPMECCGVKTVLAVPVKNETNGTTSGVLFLGSRRFSNEHQAAETAQAI